MATMFSLGTPEDGDGLLTCNSCLAHDKNDAEGYARANDCRIAGMGKMQFAVEMKLLKEGRLRL